MKNIKSIGNINKGEDINCSRMVVGVVRVLGQVRCQNKAIGSYLEERTIGEFFHSVLVFFCKEHEPNGR